MDDFVCRRVGPCAFYVEDDDSPFVQGRQQETIRITCFLRNRIDEVAELKAQAAVGFAFYGFHSPLADAGDEAQQDALQA